MTYKEYITTALSRIYVDDTTIGLLFVNQQLIIPDPEMEVDVMVAKKAICNEFALLIPMWTHISEGGSTLIMNLEYIKMWYRQLCAELGIDPVTETRIKDISNAW